MTEEVKNISKHMKPTLLLLAFILCFGSAYSNGSGSCSISSNLVTYYEDDINALAVNYMLNTADSDQISVPSNYFNEIAEGMSAIFNSSFPERDSIFDQYCVHWPWGISLGKSWMISFDTSYAWTHAWQNVQTVTGNATVDNLFAAHQLTVTNYYDWSGTHVALVSSTEFLNYDAFADSLLLIPGINWTEPDQIIGSAGTITYLNNGINRHYEFTFEWSDCFDGCDNSHTWKFDVDNSCNVNFTGTADWWVFNYLPLPTPLNCNISTGLANAGSNSDIRIFPDPFFDRLCVSTGSDEAMEMIIYDISSRKITEAHFAQSLTMSTGNFPGGVYFYVLTNRDGLIQRGKIVKQ